MANINAPLRFINGDDTITVIDPTASSVPGDIIDVATQYGTGTANIQAAINQANANWVSGSGPTTVYLKAGNWASTGTIFLKSGVTLAGAGRHATKILKSGPGPGIAAGNPGVGVVETNPNATTWLVDAGLRDFWLDCDAQTDAYIPDTAWSPKGIYLTHVRRGTFRRLGISKSQYSCFGLDYPVDHTIIDDCIAMDTKQPNVGIGGNGFGTMSGILDDEDYIITNCTAIRVRAGVVLEIWAPYMTALGRSTRVDNCLSLDCKLGFENAGVGAATFTDCVAIGSTEAGFKFGEGDHGGQDRATGAATMDNCFSFDGVIGVDCYFNTPDEAVYSGLTIQGSTIRGNSSHGIRATLDDYDVNGLTIRGNSIVDNAGHGIVVSKAAGGTGAVVDLSIGSNEIHDNTAGGIRFDADLTRGLIQGNNIVDTTGTAQPTGMTVAAGRTLTGTAFDGGLVKAATPVDLAGTLTGCHVGLIPGWTRGEGAPTVKAPAGTIYQRQDGSAGSLLYVNTDGGTAWAAFA